MKRWDERARLARRIQALCRLLLDEGCIREVRSVDHPFFFGVFFKDEYEPERTTYLTFAGDVMVHRCRYSGHNGDSYGDTYTVVEDPDQAIDELQHLNDRLERVALCVEERRLAEAARQTQLEAARSRLNVRLEEFIDDEG